MAAVKLWGDIFRHKVRSQEVKFVIIGLGNPGPKFQNSRHNIGYRCMEVLAKRHQVALSDRRPHIALGKGNLGGISVLFGKPRTFMNDSGRAIKYLTDRFAITPAQLLVITDDMDIPLGKLRLRPAGGSGGHRGLQSIISELQSSDFPRLRVGIGRPHPLDDVVDHVLSDFSNDEKPLLEEVVEKAVFMVEIVLSEGLHEAMNRFN